MQKYGSEIKYMQNHNNKKIIELLYNQENISKNLAEFVGLVVDRTKSPQIANDIIRDLTRQIYNSDSSHESIGIKNIAIFIEKLAKKQPKVIYSNIGILMGFFDCESYLLRQSLIKIISYTIIYVLCEIEQPEATVLNSDNADVHKTRQIFEQTKLKFLMILLKRFQDKSAFCRVKVMKVFAKLIEANLVPRHMYMELFQAVLGRLRDFAVAVRRQAVRLFQQMVQVYAYIFNVVDTDATFPSMEAVMNDYQQAEKNVQREEEVLKGMESQLEEQKDQVAKQYPDADSMELHQILAKNEQYQDVETKLCEQKGNHDDATNQKNLFFELGKFMAKMDDAGILLEMMLSSKTIQDTVEVIRVFKFLHRYGFGFSEKGIRKMLTLVYSKEQAVVTAVVDCYHALYFYADVPTEKKVKNLFAMMQDASLTDVTCIEGLIGILIQAKTFENDVYNILWDTYFYQGRNMVTESKKHHLGLHKECKQQQRAAIHLLRMMGSCNVEILVSKKVQLLQQSLGFANQLSPDFIILKEAALAFEKLIENQEDGASESDKKHLFSMLLVLVKNFGTKDMEWLCAAETILNTLFNVRQRVTHEQAKSFVNLIQRKCFVQSEIAQPEGLELLSLRDDLSDSHYSQLFFVVGHIAIKMLSYVEQLEVELKKAFNVNPKKSK